MDREGEERDYLVRAQPEKDPASFEQAVREAFQLEHRVAQNQEIAAVIGVDKSRITQIFKKPETLDAATIENVLSKLSGAEHRRRILRAWATARFGVDPGARERGSLVGDEATARVLRRVDRQIRESRLRTAARVATEAMRKTEDVELREQLLDRAFLVRQRLDEPGQAMAVARLIALGAQRRGEPRRHAAAHLYRARALAALESARPGDVLAALDQAERLVAGQPPVPKPPPYFVADERAVAASRTATRVALMERGLVRRDEAFLRSVLEPLAAQATAKAPFQRRYHALQLAARVHLMLGRTFQAQELLERAFDSGGARNLHAYEMCGLVQGRILAAAEGPEAALAYLREVRNVCLRTSDRYHARLADGDIARLEAELFPTTGGS